VEGVNVERIEADAHEATTVVDGPTRPVKRVHPFRGLFWGLVFGTGLAGVLIVTTTITVSIVGVIAVVVVGLVAGVVWGVAGPAKQPKGPPPRGSVPVEQVLSTRFDDFDALTAPGPGGLSHAPAEQGDRGVGAANGDQPRS
jgi:hypothetical protein